MSEDMADLQIWLDRKFNAIDGRIRKIEATNEPDAPNMVFDQVSREAVMRFCDALGINNDDGLDSVLRDIERVYTPSANESVRDNLGWAPGLVTFGTLKKFCETIGIDDDDDLKQLQDEITAFDDNLNMCWRELQELRKKDDVLDHPLLLIKDELERIEVAHRDMSRIVREHEKR